MNRLCPMLSWNKMTAWTSMAVESQSLILFYYTPKRILLFIFPLFTGFMLDRKAKHGSKIHKKI